MTYTPGLLSVIMPLYNTGEPFIACMDSLIAQTWKNIEIIIVNDGSTDNSAELAQAAWKDLGVDITVAAVDSPTLSETLFSTGDWDISAAPLTVSLPSMLVPFYSGPNPPDGTNFASIDNPEYTAAVTAASAKAGSEGCDDWGAAEQALYATTSVMPYANINRSTFATKATFTEGDGIDPTSIRMYE